VDVTGQYNIPINPTLIRIVRLLRLFRLVRLMRVLQQFSGFDNLYLMATTMKGSISILSWSCLLLFSLQMMLALFLQSVCISFVKDSSNALEARELVFMFYGTFSRSMLTMFEVTIGNWMPPCRALTENVSEWFMILFLFHKLILGFSVVNVIQGVFVQETFKVASTDDSIMLMQRERAQKCHLKKMKALFMHADEDGNGALDRDEFKAVMRDPSIKTWLSSMELDVRDADNVFTLIDDGDGKITPEELVKGVSRLKGAARSIDVLTMLSELQKVTVAAGAGAKGAEAKGKDFSANDVFQRTMASVRASVNIG
jgi:hypothetical protein